MSLFFCTVSLMDICFCVSQAANVVDVVDCGIRERRMSDQDLKLLGQSLNHMARFAVQIGAEAYIFCLCEHGWTKLLHFSHHEFIDLTRIPFFVSRLHSPNMYFTLAELFTMVSSEMYVSLLFSAHDVETSCLVIIKLATQDIISTFARQHFPFPSERQHSQFQESNLLDQTRQLFT